MVRNRQMKTIPASLPTTISAAATADYLAKALGGKAARWVTWLANDRKPGRVTRLLPPEPGPGRPRYAVTLVDTYISELRTKKAAVDGTSAMPKERRFGAHISGVTAEDGADEPFVLLVTVKPFTSYKLSADEARHLADRLMKAADRVEISPGGTK